MKKVCIFLQSTLLIVICGCEQPQPTVSEGTHATATHESHPDATEGPHGGSLIELGQEEYHAELVHDEENGQITIYLLDSHAKELVAIEADELKINLSHDGHANQFRLPADPQSVDSTGKTSRFTSKETGIGEALFLEDTTGQLVVMINGKQFRGDLSLGHEDHVHETAHKHEDQ